ncbi:hypothetical protein [Streptomyces lancefieldiae]|uniref:Uncharacterized protein n=1 Tax=Streptomyces lancefieldiae TaxID=3075520 RepID=A0ABU3AG04_9ACTN|nr:hypothetical protein [Streptomyces sp. DSM 40712]MDT0608868.1 hypothetical protein [Streptomyces sp. DSM 40712]
MARLQILELPECSGDDRPPFVLVVDQFDPPPYPSEPWPPMFDGVAEKIGARAVLVFTETIDIPANDTTAYLARPAAKQELVLDLGDYDVRAAIAADMQKMREANEGEPAKPRRDWCCSLAFQTLGKQHIDDCPQAQ